MIRSSLVQVIQAQLLLGFSVMGAEVPFMISGRFGKGNSSQFQLYHVQYLKWALQAL